MSERLLDRNPHSGLEAWFSHDAASGVSTIRYHQDAGPVIEANKRRQNESDGYSASRELRRAASIPPIIVLKWLTELGVNVFDRDHWPAVRRLLNDPDWRWLRSAPGKV